MKKINATGQPGGMPVNQGDLQTVFNDEIWDALEGLLYMFQADTQGVIVSGCVITGAGPYNISEGIVYLNGEFMRLSAASGQTLPRYIQAATPVNDARTFADTVSRTAFITKSAELAGSAPGAGQYVGITSATDPDDRRLQNLIHLRRDVIDALNNTSTDKALSANQGKTLRDSMTSEIAAEASARAAADNGKADQGSIDSDGDVNSFTNPGVYFVGSGATNAPIAGSSFTLIYVSNGLSQRVQTAIQTSGAGAGDIYNRTYDFVGGTWNAWVSQNT